MNLKKHSKSIFKIVKNPYIFSILSKISIVLLGFGYAICQARYLGPELKGDVAYITSVTGITSILFGLGIHQAYPFFKKKKTQKVKETFLKLTAILCSIYLIIAVLLTIAFNLSLTMSSILITTPILVYTKIVTYIWMVESPNSKNAVELIADLLLLILVIAMWILIPKSLLAGVCLLAFRNITLAIIFTCKLRSAFNFKSKINKQTVLQIIKYGFFPMLSLLMTTLNYRVDSIMLKQMTTSEAVGIYSVGVMLAEKVWLIPDALKEVLISKLSKGKNSQEVAFIIRICNVVCIAIVLGIIIFGKPFIGFFFGNEYLDAYQITVIILIGVIFMIYYKLIGSYNIVEGKQKENFIYLVISVVCNIALNIILIPHLGNTGAAIASIASYGLSATLFIHKFVSETDIRFRDILFITRKDIKKIAKAIKKGKQ